MGCKSYDEEDRKYARDLYCASDYKSMDKLVERMAREVPDRYGSLTKDTVNRWRKKDQELGIDWKELRAERQRSRAQRQNSLAEVQVDDIIDRTLKDMTALRDQFSEMIAALKKQDEEDRQSEEEQKSKGKGKKKAKPRPVNVSSLASLGFAYNKTVEILLSILRSKVKEVDLDRITKENQVFFIRRVFEDIGQAATEVSPEFAEMWMKFRDTLLARLRGIYKDDVITDVLKDLCLEAINARAKELDERGYLKADPGGAGTPGYHGKAAASAD